MENESSQMISLLEDFCSYIASEKGLSLHTIEAYQRDLFTFIEFLQSIGIYSWELVSEQKIIQYLSIKKENYASASLARLFVSIKVFFRFLKREGVITENPVALLGIPKVWKTIPSVLSEADITTLLDEPLQKAKHCLRDRAIMELLYACGLRVSELCSLKISDLDKEFLRVKGKGGKERIVPIGKKAAEAVESYLLSDRIIEDREDYLFNGRGKKPINRHTVGKIVKEKGKEAHLSKEIHPHTFRHTFATHLLKKGADLRVIQELLGHASIDNTDRYTHVENEQLKSKFKEFHPRN